MKVEVLRFNVTEYVVESANAKEIKEKREQLEQEGFICQNTKIGYKTGKEESKVYWFKAEKKELSGIAPLFRVKKL